MESDKTAVNYEHKLTKKNLYIYNVAFWLLKEF